MDSRLFVLLHAIVLAALVSARDSITWPTLSEANYSSTASEPLYHQVNCEPVEQAMTPVCGDKDERLYHAYVCEKQCIDAVKQLLRRKDDTHALCLTEWKAIDRVQSVECTGELAAFMPSTNSVTTIASAILSIFVLFSCTS
ncbi:hypothetical protein AC1031_000646 [Aphanomyces cochlioides]|nr:hypothetical protein AC1031_000646 [Aphanomyces cochlioides]